MTEFKKLIKEIKKTLKKLLLFDIFIETLVVFLALYLVLFIFNISKVFAFIGSIVYLFVMYYKRRDLTSINTVEQKYPILNEALRTVNDTLKEDNYLVNELRTQVKRKVKKVSASSFMNIKGDIFKIIVAICLVFFILSLSICKTTSDVCGNVLSKTDIKAAVTKIDVNQIYDFIKNQDQIKGTSLDGESVNSDLNLNSNNALFDDSSVVNLGDDKLSVKISLQDDQIDINDVSDTVEKKEFIDMDISGIDVQNDLSFKEDISKENKDIVKNYFNEISR
ncbi:MAG: DUF7502 family protein [bacterium]